MMEYCSAIKRERKPTFVGKWMQPETMKLSEKGQSPNDKYHLFSVI